MHARIPNLVFGFHGCDEKIGRALINGKKQLRASENNYDWLGHGIYFWENAPHRAWQWACEQKERGALKKPFVVGAMLDLGDCMDLLDIHHHETLKNAYELYKMMAPEGLVENKGGKDKALRYLDCAVINILHKRLNDNREKPIDSIRCAFEEGNPAFQGSNILDKAHIQICIRTTQCIKGYFRPLNTRGSALDFN